MKSRERTGFVLTLAIVAFAMLGVVMFVMTESANTLLFQADAAYLHAVQRNLTASGLAWAEVHAMDANEPSTRGAAELDITPLSARPAKLAVRVSEVHDAEALVSIETSCSKGRQNFKTSQDYAIQLR